MLRCPLPIGEIRSTIRAVVFERVVLQLEAQPLVGEQRRQVLETRPLPGLVRGHPADRVDPQESGVLLARACRPAGALDGVTAAQGEPPGLRDRDVDVLGARQVAARAQEPVALLPQVEQASDRHELALPSHFLAAALGLLGPTLAVAAAAPASAAVAGLDLADLAALAALVGLPPGL